MLVESGKENGQGIKNGDGDISMEGENPFFPFLSELDWKVAQWAVKDGPGHSAFNRLLEIPGVSLCKHLRYLSF
ncbi:hypothetical protein B0H34DRAFT_646341 [Crassisporium funariophilum]|nr:hypothetical protein B0H34DRAFT_646341 [Crassisporium funariophilum]